MIKRIKAKYGQDVIMATRISARLLSQGEDFAPLTEEIIEPGNGSHRRELKTDEAVALKNRIIRDWSQLHSEQIIDELQYLWTQKEIDLSLIDSTMQHELWLIRALAQEKDLHHDLNELEKSYQRCRGGQFQIVLVLNNLGVVHARRQWCKQSLDLFRESIRYALGYMVRNKAPFYNYALVLQNLYWQKLIYKSNYLAGLDETIQLLAMAHKSKEPEVILGFRKETSKNTWTDQEIEEGFKQIAREGHSYGKSLADDFFHSRSMFLDPEEDLFASFGDISDNRDRETAHILFQKGLSLAEEEQFAESMHAIEMATMMDPDFSVEAYQKTEQVSDLWRQKENKEIVKLIENKEFDKAANKLRYVLDNRIRRRGDKGMIETLQKQKHVALVKQADALMKEGNYKQAELEYASLLKEDLDEDLKKYVSSRLAEL